MESKKVTYADVLKNPSAFLNPGMHPTPLIPKAQRVRLSEEAKKKLRSVIYNQPKSEVTEPVNDEAIDLDVKKQGRPVKKPESVKAVTNCSQPLVLATASDWIVPGNIISSAINESKKEVSSVRLLNPKEIGSVVREGMKENPIDVCEDLDEEELKCSENFSVVKR